MIIPPLTLPNLPISRWHNAAWAVALLLILPVCASHAQEEEKPAVIPSADPATSETVDTPATEPSETEAAGPWIMDYRQAKKIAAEEGKDILMLFTGSDWIEMCQKFEQDVLTQPAFLQHAQENLVLLKIDFPHAAPQSPSTKAQNQLLMGAYRVRGFPTVILTGAEGRPYAVMGYAPVDAARYTGMIAGAEKTRERRDESFAKAETAEGVEKARLLATGIPQLPGNMAARFYKSKMEEVVALDPDNTTTKVPEYQRLLADVAYATKMRELERDTKWTDMLRVSDEYIQENNLTGEERQVVMFNQVNVLKNLGDGVSMVRMLEAIVAVDPESVHAQNAQNILEQIKLDQLQKQLVR